jgi:2-oxoglutaroyl-CoA hydrolase
MALKGGEVHLDHSEDGRIAYLTLSHGKYTVVTWEMRQLVQDRFTEIDADPRVRVVVVRSDGEHFTSGGDIAGFMEVDPIDFTDLGHNITAAARSTRPVIAAIDGYCFGVGCEMALSCDIRLGTPRTQFALPEMNLGMIPGSGGTQRLSRLIGLSRAKFHIMTATRIAAQQALDWGILAELHDDRPSLYAAADALAAKMANFSPAAQRTAKEVLDKGIDGPLYTGIDLERKAYAMLRATHDFAEGVAAFGEKRKPEFTGR